MIDTHCHLDLYPDPLKLAKECEKKGILTIAMTNLPSHFEQGYRHLISFKKVRLALGLHPLHAEDHEKELPLFQRYVEKTSYMGEIGLDFSREGRATKDIQLTSFKSILTTIKGSKKLLSLHSRGAEKEVLENLIRNECKSAIFHWYTGPISLIEDISNAGFMFSVNPAMIKSKNGQSIISKIPRSKILTESDGPFIKHGSRQVKPSDVISVLGYLSNLWNLPVEDVDKLINENFSRIISTIR
jgi:TatD DNase family protein